MAIKPRRRPPRIVYGALAGALGTACMTVLRMAARRRGVIEKTVAQAAEEWVAARAGMGRGAHPAVHHLLDQAMHVGYGAALGAAYGLALDPRAGTRRSAHLGARGAAYGLATWLFGSWLLLPSLRAKQAPWRKRASENAVDLAAHLLFGAVTALVTEEMRAQPDRGPSSDEHRRATAIG